MLTSPSRPRPRSWPRTLSLTSPRQNLIESVTQRSGTPCSALLVRGSRAATKTRLVPTGDFTKPVPVRTEVVSAPEASVITLSSALREPGPPGRNRTSIRQLSPDAITRPEQLFEVTSNSPGLIPEIMTGPMSRSPLPLLIRVIAFTAEVVPGFCLPKSRTCGTRVAPGSSSGKPVPVSSIKSGEVEESETSSRLAWFGPSFSVSNWVTSMHDLPGSS